LAAEIKKHLGLDSSLTAGSGGVFDVSVDGAVLFSKKQVGRFPEADEIVAMLQKKK